MNIIYNQFICAYNCSVQSSIARLHTINYFYLMFGGQPCLPVDVMYRPIEKPLQSYGEYAKLFQHRLQRGSDLVKQHITTEHLHQKEFYDQDVYGKPYKMGDLVWLHSPVPKRDSCCKLHYPWAGPFKVLKWLPDTTYHIQNLHGNWQRKVVHFDRLKPCTNGVIQIDNAQMATQDHIPPLNTAAVNLPPSIGTNVELLDDDSDDTSAGSGSTSSGHP